MLGSTNVPASLLRRKDGKRHGYWALDRGMVSEENLRVFEGSGARYIVGTPKGMLKRFAPELRSRDLEQCGKGLEVRGCPLLVPGNISSLPEHAEERERAGQARAFEKRIAEGLEKIMASCRKRKQLPAVVGQRVGRLLGPELTSGGSVCSKRSMPM